MSSINITGHSFCFCILMNMSNRLLDRFFVFYSSWGMRIIPEFFLRDMHHAIHHHLSQPSPNAVSSHGHAKILPHYSAFLHLCIMAVATAFSDDPGISSLATRARFADEAKRMIEDECARPSIAAVQGLSMLGSYHSGKGQQTLGFVYFGEQASLLFHRKEPSDADTVHFR